MPPYDVERERALEKATAALRVFDAEARNAGISYNCQAMTALPEESGAMVSVAARIHDLTVVLQPGPDQVTPDNAIAEDVLFQSGGPILMLPYIHKGPCEPTRIGIAWDGSRAAAHAVRDAAPFLARASSITIISINENDAVPPEAKSAALASHLARRGLIAKIERSTADTADIQPMLLSVAADMDIDLMVMGGYGHSRLHERILGDVTRRTFESMTIPALMSH